MGRSRKAPRKPKGEPAPVSATETSWEAPVPEPGESKCRCGDSAFVTLTRTSIADWKRRISRREEQVRSEMDAFRSDNVRLAGENVRLRRSLRHELDLSVASPAFVGGLGGRTAIEDYRNKTIGKFIQHVHNAGDFALVHGPAEAAFFLRTIVKADLECLFAAPPATEEEGIRRADCEWMLTVREATEILAGTEEWNESARENFIARVLSAGVDTSTQELVRRSGEMIRGPTPRPDDDEG